jgi:hypothetical protein
MRLFLLIDLGTNEILICTASDTFKAEELSKEVVKVLQIRFGELKHNRPLYIHSDRGGEFTSYEWQNIPTKLGDILPDTEGAVILSMSKPATPGHNAVIERFNLYVRRTSFMDYIDPLKKGHTHFNTKKQAEKHMSCFKDHHNETHISKRSFDRNPNTAYSICKQAAKILPLPDPAIAKNTSSSSSADSIRAYRTDALQLQENRYQPSGVQADVVQALQLINNNVVNIGETHNSKFKDLNNQLDQIQTSVNKLLPKTKHKKIKGPQREAFSAELIKQLTHALKTPSTFSHHTQRNHLVIQLLFGSGIRCNETKQLNIQNLQDLANNKIIQILETKTKNLRNISIGSSAATLLREALPYYIQTLKLS